jgi:HlyD family secretion protein
VKGNLIVNVKSKSLRAYCRHLAWALPLSLLGLLVPVALTGCGSSGAATSEDSEKPLEVSVVYPERTDLTRVVEQPGELIPIEQTPIYTKIAGYAKEVKFDRGDRVKKGTLLVELDVPEEDRKLKVLEAQAIKADAELLQAKENAEAAHAATEASAAEINAKQATIHASEAEVKRWEAEYKRATKLVKSGTYDGQTGDEQLKQYESSKATLEESNAKWLQAKALDKQAIANFHKAQADVKVAEAGVSVAYTAVKQWEDWLGYKYIRAPYDGVITQRNVHEGHFLQPSNEIQPGPTNDLLHPLFYMMRTEIMRVTVDVPEMDAVWVRDGDKAIVQLQAMPDREFIGTVTRNSRSLDKGSRTLRVEIWLDNKNNELTPFQYAKVRIMAKLPKTTMLPQMAIQSDIMSQGGTPYCFVVENGKAVKYLLKMGARCVEGTQVMQKQRPGSNTWEDFTGKEAVIVTNPGALVDGQDVEVKAADSKAEGTKVAGAT